MPIPRTSRVLFRQWLQNSSEHMDCHRLSLSTDRVVLRHLHLFHRREWVSHHHPVECAEQRCDRREKCNVIAMPCRAELLWVSACGQANGITLWRNVTSARLTSNNSNNSNNPVDCQRHQVPYSFQSCVTGGASFSMYGLFLRYSVPDSVRCCCMDSFFVFQWQKNAKERTTAGKCTFFSLRYRRLRW